MGVAEGSHRIGGSRKTLQALAGQAGLPERARQVFARAVNRVSQEGGLRYSLSAYGVVVSGPGAGSALTSDTQGSQRVIRFPLRWFDISAKVQPTVLLGENLSDVSVLVMMARTAVVTTDIKYLPVQCSMDNGGGSTTNQVLGSVIAANRHCICIVDSDRASPAGNMGTTAASVQPYKRPAVYPTVEVIETLGRDLENCLPIKFYRDEYRKHPDYSPLSELLERVSKAGEDDLRFHIDIEKGVELRRIFGYPAGSADRAFWNTKIPILCHHIGYPAGHFACMTASVYSITPHAPCTCVLVRGIPQNILDRFAERFEAHVGHHLAAMLSEREKAEWVRVGIAIASWCCGDSKMRA